MAYEPRKEVGGIKITWHAIVRFIERSYKLDLGPIRKKFFNRDHHVVKFLEKEGRVDIDKLLQKIMDNKLWSMIYSAGTADGEYTYKGITAVVLNGRIVTFLDARK